MVATTCLTALGGSGIRTYGHLGYTGQPAGHSVIRAAMYLVYPGIRAYGHSGIRAYGHTGL